MWKQCFFHVYPAVLCCVSPGMYFYTTPFRAVCALCTFVQSKHFGEVMMKMWREEQKTWRYKNTTVLEEQVSHRHFKHSKAEIQNQKDSGLRIFFKHIRNKMLTKEGTISLKDNKRCLLLNKIHLKINFKQGRCATERLQLVKFSLYEHQEFQAL